MHLEEFAEGSTFLHRLDPRVKFLTVMPLVVLVAVMRGIEGPLYALAIGIAFSALARLEPGKLLQRLLAVNFFVLMLWVFLPFGVPGREVFSVGPWAASREGMSYALSITVKANAIVLLTIAVFGTSEAMSLAHALVHLRAPEKLVYLFFFFYRYISVLHGEYSRLRKAMAVRCFRPDARLHTYRTYAYLVGMLLVRSYERSQRIYDAMLCRGFRGHFPVAAHFHLHKADLAFGALMAAITVFLCIIGMDAASPN
jgi:cobalt/nickel transport system permease protein